MSPVQTSQQTPPGSGQLCYPGKLKRGQALAVAAIAIGSGQLCYPGKLKLDLDLLVEGVEADPVPDSSAIRGS